MKEYSLYLFRAFVVVGIGVFCAGLGGCASIAKPEPRKLSCVTHSKKKGPCRSTYEVNNRQYCVLQSSRGFKQKGEASWYGPGFHGQRTASGKRYNQNKLTAAHKTLPFGTRVVVTNLQNKKSVKVKINDRGPFHGHRIIDLSKRAAEVIGLKGVARVRIKAI